MKTTNIYVATRYYGGTNLARVYEPPMNFKASSTNSPKVAAEVCATKAAGRKPLEVQDIGSGRYRCVFELLT